jgi:hypothetical protein
MRCARSGAVRSRADRGIWNIAPSLFNKSLVQRVQLVRMAVIGCPRSADYRRAETAQQVGKLVVIEHTVIEAEIAGFCLHPRHPCLTLFEFGLIEAEMDATRSLMPDQDVRALEELGSECRPFIRRGTCPALIMRRAVSFALYLDQPEIAARRAKSDVAFVEERSAKPCAGQSICDRRADQPAPDHERIIRYSWVPHLKTIELVEDDQKRRYADGAEIAGS